MTAEPWKAVLWASGDFPETTIEIVSTDTSAKTATIRLLKSGANPWTKGAWECPPENIDKLITVDLIALIDWTSDWYNPNTGYSGHCDTFSNPRPPHPITGLHGPPNWHRLFHLLW